jgi:glycosyltransferase involved in cell wall biosynthesis
VPDFRLLLFGQGPDRARFERAVRAAGLDRVVLFCGFDPDWPSLVPGLELLLHPARREGLGVVVLEAMSAGVPVVASAVGGTVDIVTPGVNGELLAPRDVDAWAQTVVRLLCEENSRERLANKARKRVETVYTIDRMASSYLNLYDDIRKQNV